MPDFASEAEKSRSTKIALRNRMITFRRSIHELERLSAARAVQGHLRTLLTSALPKTSSEQSAETAFANSSPAVTAYVPIGAEPGGSDLPEVLAAARPPGAHLLLPVLLDDGDLDWALYQGLDSLRPGPRGLREPAGPRLGPEAIRSASVVIVPALAVDRAGRRLGRGGGSYDRALARATDAFTVALLYDEELVNVVPAEEHDQPVRATITPRGGLTLSADPEWTK